jgi:hypothetical protein
MTLIFCASRPLPENTNQAVSRTTMRDDFIATFPPREYSRRQMKPFPRARASIRLAQNDATIPHILHFICANFE